MLKKPTKYKNKLMTRKEYLANWALQAQKRFNLIHTDLIQLIKETTKMDQEL